MGATGAARALLATATLAAVAVVPDWPWRHLDDPAYWGVVGFLVLVGLSLARPRTGDGLRRRVRAMLLALPLVYVASGLRWDAGSAALAVQGAGLLAWGFLAVRAGRSDRLLWAGCAAHAVWDAAHFGRVGFIADWYVAACLAADLGMAAFVLLTLAPSGRSPAPERPH